ncbi:MAG: hypothetical protein UX33_C0017G0002 [Candidatus Azambacteria bacterium GW2011_GWC1_46_13]|uniref:Uncharacterized protein n=1 Tax=Candidatus Azambacteria bacterium GW2011_GWC1_46_13 TaxID=1618619 RepID=A0A0G1NNG6_9BACT|nr:MAG: hypothetical protein UX33_C0017G0002 [Candidatus Azambacteria bacterium GW2011_GWC1_46_13]
MNQKGFTLIELIIYIAIFAVISLVLTDFFITLAKVRAQTEARGEVRQNLSRTMERLSQVIHSASGVNSASGNTLSLAMTDSAKNPTIFTVTENALTIQEGASPATALTSDKVIIGKLSFASINNPSPAKKSVQLSVTVDYDAKERPDYIYSSSATTTAVLRN